MIEQIFDLMKFEPGLGMIPSILLLLIWLNIRSLKKVLTRLEEDHENRIGSLEVKQLSLEGKSDNHEQRIGHLETKP